VTVTGAGYTSPTVTLSAGIATILIPAAALPIGLNVLTASYTPDLSSSPTYTSSASTSASVTVAKATPTVTLTPSSSSIIATQALTVTVAVSGGIGSPIPTGTVTMTGGGYTSAAVPLIGGAATISIPAGSLNGGASTLTATYNGDATYNVVSGSTSVTVSLIAITLSNLTTVAPGTSITGVATLLSGNTYSGTINLSCTLTSSPSGAQNLPTCGLDPASLTIVSGKTATSVLTVHTTTATITVAQSNTLDLKILGGGGAVLASVLMFGISGRRRRWMSMLILMWTIAVAGVTGCGGAISTSSSSAGGTAPATTKGTYAFVVTGTDSTDPTITTSTNFTITVQ
jgi:hypothetical protein